MRLGRAGSEKDEIKAFVDIWTLVGTDESSEPQGCLSLRMLPWRGGVYASTRRMLCTILYARALAEFIDLVGSFDFEVKMLYVESKFYVGKCLTLIPAHKLAYIVPIIK